MTLDGLWNNQNSRPLPGSSEAGDGPLLKGSGETLSLSIEETK